MKPVNLLGHRIHKKARIRPAIRLNLELCEDRTLLTNYLVTSAADTNTGTGNTGTLRYVLNQLAITGTAANVIDFNIPGSGVQTISPTTPLPTITKPVVIDGYTQPGAAQNTLENGDNAVLLIELNGALAPAGSDGLLISGGGSTVEGLIIGGFSEVFDSTSPTDFRGGNSIELETSGGNTIQGNFLGTTGLSNEQDGVLIDGGSGNNTIGGTIPASRNIVSANLSEGIGIYALNSAGSDNLVTGNYIGTDVTGTANAGNGDGIYINAPNNTIGGTGNAANTIGFNGDAIDIIGSSASGNVVLGNFIGTNASGSNLGNGDGIFIEAPNNTVGGTANAANTIGFNQFDGIDIFQSGLTGNTVLGNFIGTNAGGSNLGNGGDGIYIEASDDTIGAVGNGANTVRFNSEGIVIDGSATSDSVVQGAQIENSASNNTISGNTISNNITTSGPGSGVEIIRRRRHRKRGAGQFHLEQRRRRVHQWSTEQHNWRHGTRSQHDQQ